MDLSRRGALSKGPFWEARPSPLRWFRPGGSGRLKFQVSVGPVVFRWKTSSLTARGRGRRGARRGAHAALQRDPLFARQQVSFPLQEGRWARRGSPLRGPQPPASPRGARPLGEGAVSAGPSAPLPRPLPGAWNLQVRPRPELGAQGDTSSVFRDHPKKLPLGRSWGGEFLGKPGGSFLRWRGHPPISNRIRRAG